MNNIIITHVFFPLLCIRSRVEGHNYQCDSEAIDYNIRGYTPYTVSREPPSQSNFQKSKSRQFFGIRNFETGSELHNHLIETLYGI